MNYKKATIQLIIIASICRIVIASVINLGNDEVYYRLYANHLDYNYFDHPPMVAFLIRLSTLNLNIDNDLFIRLGAIICCGISTWFIFKCGEKIQNDKVGFFASILYTTSIYTSIIAGTFILPDSPQVLFWTIGLYLLLNISENKTVTNKKKKYLFYFGIIVGLAFLSKISSIFLPFGLLLFIISSNKRWLKEKTLYYSMFVFILFTFPIVFWNFKNNFVTLFYHGDRVNVSNNGFDLNNFLQFNIGQIFYQNPIVFVLIIIGFINLIRKKYTIPLLQKRILIYSSLPLIILATCISLFKQILPHWTGPAFISLQLITACYLANLKIKYTIPISLIAAKTFIFIIVIAGVLSIHFLPKTIGSNEYANLGSNDFTLDMYGWKNVAKEFKTIVEKNNGKNAIIVSNGWFPAAHIQHYIAEPLHMPVVAFGNLDKIHQYFWWNKLVDYKNKTKDVYIISPSNFNYNNNPDSNLMKNSPTAIDTIFQYRSNKLVRFFVVTLYKNVTLQ